MGARPRLALATAVMFLAAVAGMWWVAAGQDDEDPLAGGAGGATATTVDRPAPTVTAPGAPPPTVPPVPSTVAGVVAPTSPGGGPGPTAGTAPTRPPRTTVPPVATLPPVTVAPAPPTATTTGGGDGLVLLAAGDIASCRSDGDEATAALLDQLPGTVATLGDNVYERGTASEFQQCYAPSWGRHRPRTRPAPGNHDYATRGAEGYFGYFGAAAGDPDRGYYSYELGTWHVVVLNSNCGAVSCAAGDAQERWLREDLASHPAACTLAYWHHAPFSSGLHGGNEAVAPLFTALWDLGADVVLAGHDHHYERFSPLGPTGVPDATRGIRSFVVGTGGRSHYPVGRPEPGSEVRDAETFGVLALTLRTGAYDWRFLPVAGQTFTDAGSGRCH